MKNTRLMKILKTSLPVLSGFFVMGFCDIVGISSDYAASAFGWSATVAGFVPSVVFVWFLLLGIPTGVVMTRLGRKNTVLLSMVVSVVGMFLPLIIHNGTTTLIAYALLGIGNAILQVSLNPLLKNVVRREKLLTSSLTAGQVVKAISSFCGPFIMLLAVNVLGGGNQENWYLAFPIMGGITLLSAVWLWVTPIEHEPPMESTVTIKNTFALLKDSTILIMFLGIFSVVAIDVGTNFVSSKVMIGRYGWTLAQAGRATQTYVISRTIGAFLGALLMTKIREIVYFRWNIVACILVILLLALVQGTPLFALVMIGAIGFLCSCIFPIVYAIAMKRMPDKTNVISGLMITAVAGGGAMTPLIGGATDAIGINAGVSILLVCAFYLAYCAFSGKEAA